MFLLKFINIIFLFIATGSFFCGGQTLVTIPPSNPLGLWKPLDPQSIYPYLHFLPDNLVNLDSRADTTYWFQYTIEDHVLNLKSGDQIIKNKILHWDQDSLVFESIFNIQRRTAFAPCSITVNAIKNKLLNKDISTIKNTWHPCFQQKSTLIRDEENESFNWNALVFSRNNKTAFVVEGNWQDRQQISRITIMDEQISTTSGVSVRDSFEKIQALVDSTIPTEPDGFLSLRDKEDPDIFYLMDISKYPKLFYGVDRLSEIPGSVKVESIVVMKR